MNERKIIRQVSRILGVGGKDAPKTLERFKREVEEMEKELAQNYSD